MKPHLCKKTTKKNKKLIMEYCFRSRSMVGLLPGLAGKTFILQVRIKQSNPFRFQMKSDILL